MSIRISVVKPEKWHEWWTKSLDGVGELAYASRKDGGSIPVFKCPKCSHVSVMLSNKILVVEPLTVEGKVRCGWCRAMFKISEGSMVVLEEGSRFAK
ncbi:MAG: hypothetical protein QXO47_10025 [Thermoproteota archaeon]